MHTYTPSFNICKGHSKSSHIYVWFVLHMSRNEDDNPNKNRTAPMRRTWIYTRDSQYKDLEAVQGHQAAQPFPDGHHYPHNIVKIIHDKDRRRSLHLETLIISHNPTLIHWRVVVNKPVYMSLKITSSVAEYMGPPRRKVIGI